MRRLWNLLWTFGWPGPVFGALMLFCLIAGVSNRIAGGPDPLRPVAAAAATSSNTQQELATIAAGAVLPRGITTEAAALPWRIYPGAAAVESAAYREILHGARNEIGHVTLVFYAGTVERNAGYEAIRAQAEVFGSPERLFFGERGSVTMADGVLSGDVVFERCGTVVHLTRSGASREELLVEAQQIDHAVQQRVCPHVAP